MQTNIKKVLGAAIFIVIIGIIAWNVGGSSADGKTIKIGVVLPLTGTQAHVGEGLKNAVELAEKNLGSTKFKYDVIFEDDRFDPKTAVTAAQKLISIDKVDAILDAYASIGNAVSPITEKAGITHIGIAFDPKIAEGSHNFLLFTRPDTAARTFLEEMRRRDIHTLGIFRLNNQGILAVYQSVKNLAGEYGVTIVSDESFQPGERDFKEIITKSAKGKAGVYALLTLSPELEILAKQLNDQGIHNQTSIIYFELAQDKAVFNGLWSVGYGKVSTDLESEYKAAYGKDLTFGVPNIYDAFNVIVRASEAYAGKGKPTSDYIAQQILQASDVEGALGKLHVSPERIIDSPALIKVMKDGKMVFVQ
ncbi:MAG: ABC-type branched-chain amino acid transport system, periplasmic component, branched-chain amino [Candidatus Taylorbacteria bacterium]|nr:ABC-type branched-chain amino acid transport system, periplasmic component, branched-chain amino [Candidatus Taylorbacteria bacterium]